MKTQRKSGILLHPTSFPSPYGIGSFDQWAYHWIDFFAESKQSLWQVLPLGPTGYGDSPYQSFSTFAGNPYLISLPDLVADNILEQAILDTAPPLPADSVDFGAIYQWKLPLLAAVSAGFHHRASAQLRDEFQHFCTQNSEWLDDYALFMALKNAHNGAPWNQWEMALRSRQPDAIAAATRFQAKAIQAHKLAQWLFYRQWQMVRAYASEKGIQIIGDIPIFVAMDSADAWANPAEFYLDELFQPTVVAGVPPDYFSETGQLWGNPLYRWDVMAKNGYQWWIRRIQAAQRLYDIVRVDHFRGFAGYWEVPAQEQTAINGQWQKGPGAPFFHRLKDALGALPIIAEDLGEITDDVIELRDQFGFPGMKVLQFAFGGDASNAFLPHNHLPNFVVYSGTHDNATTRGWYEQDSTEAERDHFRRYNQVDGSDPGWALIRTAFASVANTAIVPLQDVLSLDNSARMNLPGRADGNWTWRYQHEKLDDGVRARLREVTELYGR
ncbi:MAG: 4-alpha-glucanotransferase [Chloroflexota bacterium]